MKLQLSFGKSVRLVRFINYSTGYWLAKPIAAAERWLNPRMYPMQSDTFRSMLEKNDMTY